MRKRQTWLSRDQEVSRTTDRRGPALGRLAIRWAATVLPLPAALLMWELVSRSGAFNSQLFPPPSSVWRAFVHACRSGEMLSDVAVSAKRALVGYGLGCVAGILVGIVTGRLALAERALGQIIHVLRAFPPVAIVPLAITWFGLTEGSKYFLVFWGVLFPVWVNTHAGMSYVEETYLWAGRTLGARRKDLITNVLLPAALPQILAGMRVAIGICFICVFVAEMAGAYEGVGFRISTSYLIFRVDKMLASLIVLGAMGAAADQLFKLGTGRLFPWIGLGRRA